MHILGLKTIIFSLKRFKLTKKWTLVEVMAWHQTCRYLNQKLLNCMMPNGITKPQWVKNIVFPHTMKIQCLHIFSEILSLSNLPGCLSFVNQCFPINNVISSNILYIILMALYAGGSPDGTIKLYCGHVPWNLINPFYCVHRFWTHKCSMKLHWKDCQRTGVNTGSGYGLVPSGSKP